MEKGYYILWLSSCNEHCNPSQSTIKMEKGYYFNSKLWALKKAAVSQSTIKMEKGYYSITTNIKKHKFKVAIHNKNGKGLLPRKYRRKWSPKWKSQSTIKMEKGYYNNAITHNPSQYNRSQSTIKMEKGYYRGLAKYIIQLTGSQSTIKMGKVSYPTNGIRNRCRPKTSQSTIKMEKGYYSFFRIRCIVIRCCRNPQ